MKTYLVGCTACLSISLVACTTDVPANGAGGDGGGSDGGVSVDGAAPSSCADPNAPKCAHGKCTENGGAPVTCACDAGYTGPLCADCAAGFQDKDANGTCAPVCAPTACGTHSACSDATGTATCACVTGYSLSGTACTWTGGPLDPGFQNTPPNAWTMTAGLEFHPTAAGSIEPGIVHFDNTMICTTKARVTQTVPMPLYSTAEPLALRVVNKVVCTDLGSQTCTESGGSDVHGIGVSLNKGFVEVASADAFSGQVLCLGERAYGGPLELVLTAEGDSCGGDVTYDAVIDHADIEPTPSCPVAGVIPNATFATSDGWVVSAGGGIAEIVNGAGTAGARGAHVQAMHLGDVPSVSQNLSIPADATTSHLALTMNFTGNQGGLQVSMGGQDIGELIGASGAQVGKVCVPDWAKGMVLPVRIGADFSNDGAGGASTFDYRDFTFDAVKWTSDPTCPAPASTVDPGFERTDPASAWVLHASKGFNSTPISEIKNDAAAHTGSRSLHLAVAGGCTKATAVNYYTVPAATSTEGPAISFWYKAQASAGGELRATPSSVALPAAAMWTKKLTCLDPKTSGRAAKMQLIFSATIPTCTTTFAQLDAYVDDVTAGTDPSCPH